MKTLQMTTLTVIAMMVSASFGSNMVKSKSGDLDLLTARGGDKVACTVHFSDELKLLKEAGADALVKGICLGWVSKDKIEFIAKAVADQSIDLENFDISSWIDNQTGVFVLENNVEDFEKVTIDRDFREYLTYTMDREQTEMKNGEN